MTSKERIKLYFQSPEYQQWASGINSLVDNLEDRLENRSTDPGVFNQDEIHSFVLGSADPDMEGLQKLREELKQLSADDIALRIQGFLDWKRMNEEEETEE